MKEHCEKPDVALAYPYFDFNDTEKQKVSNLMSTLLAQLYNKLNDLPEQLKSLYKGCNEGKQRAALRELKTMSSLIVKDLDDVFIVIDALDECPKDGDRTTALYWAAGNGHEAVVRLLLEHHADVNAKDSDGATALYEAARYGHEAVVRLLLEYHADVDAKDSSGAKALYWAACNGHEAVVRLLEAKRE